MMITNNKKNTHIHTTVENFGVSKIFFKEIINFI